MHAEQVDRCAPPERSQTMEKVACSEHGGKLASLHGNFVSVSKSTTSTQSRVHYPWSSVVGDHGSSFTTK